MDRDEHNDPVPVPKDIGGRRVSPASTKSKKKKTRFSDEFLGDEYIAGARLGGTGVATETKCSVGIPFSMTNGCTNIEAFIELHEKYEPHKRDYSYIRRRNRPASHSTEYFDA
ncbi:hypothetical protein LTR86_009494 [Recurvomyces mirabilis]|nr:hypothetical protein LTR86_009494 [Recurvomyces mirabilis]